MNYNEVVSAWLNLLSTDSTEIDFQTLIPRAIEATELQIYRDMDFLYTVTTGTNTLSTGSRQVTLPQGMIILRSTNVIKPSSQINPDAGARNPMTRVTNEFMDTVYGSPTVTGTPQYYAMLTDTTMLVAPWPDQTYTVEFIGTYRPAQLTNANNGTSRNFLTTNMPDLYIASGMMFWSAYYQNYGAQSDNPQIAVSWSQRYKEILNGILGSGGVNIETLRQKAASYSWTPYQPTPQANISRDRNAAA